MQLGEKIRELRVRRHLTVQQLADASGLSKGFISQVENGRTLPSLGTLNDLSRALATSVAYLVVEEERVPTVVRATERRRLNLGGNTSRVESLSSHPRRNLDLVLAELPPGLSAKDKMHLHHGEECMFVVEGQVRLTHGEHVCDLSAGDACQFDGRIPHSVENRGTTTARVLIAMTPAAFEPLIKVRAGRNSAPARVGARGA